MSIDSYFVWNTIRVIVLCDEKSFRRIEPDDWKTVFWPYNDGWSVFVGPNETVGNERRWQPEGGRRQSVRTKNSVYTRVETTRVFVRLEISVLFFFLVLLFITDGIARYVSHRESVYGGVSRAVFTERLRINSRPPQFVPVPGGVIRGWLRRETRTGGGCQDSDKKIK